MYFSDDDGKMNRWFEIDENRSINQTPLKDLIPIGSKPRMKRKTW